MNVQTLHPISEITVTKDEILLLTFLNHHDVLQGLSSLDLFFMLLVIPGDRCWSLLHNRYIKIYGCANSFGDQNDRRVGNNIPRIIIIESLRMK